ncbi:hypothetical protein D0S45_01545 [Marinifilum sp. JC120]|nr:hypothetical protein D0S45_01545 [Marinifilum sp. JC120]
MSTPLPAGEIIFNEIIGSLNDLVDDIEIDEISRARQVRDLTEKAIGLKRIDIAMGLSALGSIACVQNDIKAMHRYHKMSLQHKTDSLLLFNYAASMAVCGDSEDALSYAKVACDLEPSNLTMLGFIIELAAETGETKTFLRYAAAWEKLKEEPHELYTKYLAEVQELNELSDFCMISSESALAEVWDSPEEDEAWAHLQ